MEEKELVIRMQKGDEQADENPTEQSDLGIMEQEERHEIRRAMEKLPIKQKTIIILFYFNDMSVTQISKVWNVVKVQ